MIAFITQTFLKTEIIDRGLAKTIKESSYLREKSDYDDFYIASKDESEKQLEKAKAFVNAVQEYMKQNGI